MFPVALPIYPVAAIREIEAQTIADAHPPLMERAGAAAAQLALELVQRPAKVLIACGPGNNGGDGFVMALHLRRAGIDARVAFAADPARLPPDAAAAYAAWDDAGGTTHPELPAPPSNGWALVVDALFGIGLQRPLEGRYAAWIDTLNAQNCPRLALDIPSGLDADSGVCLGEHCFAATHTITFIAHKPGLLTLDGPDLCGEVTVAPIGLTPETLVPAPGRQISPALFAHHLHRRRANSHKGSYGDAAIVGGAPGMIGATLLAGRAAIHLGAGRVLLGLLDRSAVAVDLLRPELMFRTAEALLADPAMHAIAIGPGLGQSESAHRLVDYALNLPKPLVLDADALNLVATDSDLQYALAIRSAPSLLTPHPAEAARLLECTTAEVQKNRVAAATTIAERYSAWVVLKGNGSIISSPQQNWWINSSGNPAMATAGMGDVLTGLLVGLLSRGWSAQDAMLAAVHLHGVAADHYCAAQRIDSGLLADEIAPAARQCFNAWILDHDQHKPND